MLLMEERLTENCLWYLFLRAKYVFSIPFMSMNGVNKGQIFLSFTNFNDLFLVQFPFVFSFVLAKGMFEYTDTE